MHYTLSGGGVTSGSGTARLVGAPEHSGDGGVAVPIHGSRYTQVLMATMAPAVSDGFSHPFPPVIRLPLALPVCVNTGGGSVATVPVGV